MGWRRRNRASGKAEVGWLRTFRVSRPGVTGDFGDGDEVFAAADEPGDEAMPTDVRGGGVVQPGVSGHSR
jgi:hypothetical protein